MTPADSSSRGRIQQLDGLRGIAILGVVLYHYIYLAQAPEASGLAALALAPLRLGREGVDLFFVLSGFLISSILLRNRGAANYYEVFFTRRVCRIFPLYFVVLLAAAVLAAIFPAWLIFTDQFPAWVYAVFLQNFWMTFQNAFGHPALSVTWSLAVEEQFYLLLPFLMRRFGTAGMMRICVGAIIGAPLFRLACHLFDPAQSPIATYVLLPSRADAFAWGCLVAVVYATKPEIFSRMRRPLIVAVALMAVGGGVAYQFRHNALGMELGHSLISLLFASLLVLALMPASNAILRGWNFILNLGLLRAMGIRCFGIYLFHSAVLEFLRVAMKDSPFLLVVGTAAAITALLSWASWAWLEKPFVDWSHKRARYQAA